MQEPFSIADAVSQCVIIFAADAAKKNVELRCVIDPKVPGIAHGDETRLKQLMINIIGNAVKFTEQGFVAVDVRVEEIGVCPSGVYILKFSVTDMY